MRTHWAAGDAWGLRGDAAGGGAEEELQAARQQIAELRDAQRQSDRVIEDLRRSAGQSERELHLLSEQLRYMGLDLGKALNANRGLGQKEGSAVPVCPRPSPLSTFDGLQSTSQMVRSVPDWCPRVKPVSAGRGVQRRH